MAEYSAHGKVKEDYKQWIEENCPLRGSQKEEITMLTHCTSPNLRNEIVKDGYLKMNPTPGEWKEPLALDDAPKGVWFAATLWNGCLPNKSPFGTERVLKPVSSLQKDLGTNTLVMYLEAIKFRDNKRNVRLVLLKGDDQIKIDWCEKNGLHQLDIHDNPLLSINMHEETWIWETARNEPMSGRPDTWVVVFIADDVDIRDCVWDTINPHSYCSACFRCGGNGHWARDCPK